MNPRTDLHCHVAPQAYLEAAAAGRIRTGRRIDAPGLERQAFASWTVTAGEIGQRLAARGLEAGLISLVPAAVPMGGDRVAMDEAVRCANETLLAWAGRADGDSPLRGVGVASADGGAAAAEGMAGRSPVAGLLATIDLHDGERAATELAWALDRGFRGASIGTSRGPSGEGLDGPDLEPLWASAEAAGAVLFMHPIEPAADPRYGRHYLSNLAGNPVETGVAVAGLIFGGVLARHPRLRIVLAHGGGVTVGLLGRWDAGADVRAAETGDPGGRPSELAARLYYDTLTHDPRLVRLLRERVGLEHLVLGTDHPFPMGDAHPLETLAAAGLSEAERDLVAREVPARLLAPAPSATGGSGDEHGRSLGAPAR